MKKIINPVWCKNYTGFLSVGIVLKGMDLKSLRGFVVSFLSLD